METKKLTLNITYVCVVDNIVDNSIIKNNAMHQEWFKEFQWMEEIETIHMFIDTSLEVKDIERESNKGTYVKHHILESNCIEDNDHQIPIVLQFHCKHQEGEISSGSKNI